MKCSDCKRYRTKECYTNPLGEDHDSVEQLTCFMPKDSPKMDSASRRNVKCTKCGLENSDQAQFCQVCGAALQTQVLRPDTLRIGLDQKALGVVGLIAGVLALVGIFLPWVKLSGWGMSVSASAWDSVTRATVLEGEGVSREPWACIALAGAILILVGALSALASPRTRILWGVLVIGGLLAIAGSAWGFSAIPTVGILGISGGHGVGEYLTLVGGILGLVGALGLWRG